MTTYYKPLGHSFVDQKLLLVALTHRSYHNENRRESQSNNERLEFLGDAVLGLALSDLLMQFFPEDTEGQLSKKRASLVNESVLSELALEIGLNQFVRLGRGELASGGLAKPSVLASGFEALIGAIYLDSDFHSAKKWIEQRFLNRLQTLTPQVDFAKDFKTRLQEKTQQKWREVPEYKMISEEGPPHSRTFVVEVWVQGRLLGIGSGKSKKMAEQSAAEKAFQDFCDSSTVAAIEELASVKK